MTALPVTDSLRAEAEALARDADAIRAARRRGAALACSRVHREWAVGQVTAEALMEALTALLVEAQGDEPPDWRNSARAAGALFAMGEAEDARRQDLHTRQMYAAAAGIPQLTDPASALAAALAATEKA